MPAVGERRQPTMLAKLTPLQLHRKVGLMRVGLTAADIARELGVSRQTVSLVLRDKVQSRRIQTAIANAIGKPVEHLFPSTAA
jgi:DNA-binding XRE family transcriptional regulator